MRLRFVTCNDPLSKMIRDREGEGTPFTPSHVELVVAEGYLGAHYDGGVQIRPVGYDKALLLNELFVTVPLTTDGDAAAEKYARGKIDAPYDWAAILDFVLPTDLHLEDHVICSAFMTLTAEAGSAFAYPLAKPAHAVSPLDLMFWFSGRNLVHGAQDKDLRL
jgi:hypothetical protein